jgi:hypothetical protein
MLPLEMVSPAPMPYINPSASELELTEDLLQDFAHEAWNSDKAKSDFAPLIGKTAVYIPEVLWAEKRCMVMECEPNRQDSS